MTLAFLLVIGLSACGRGAGDYSPMVFNVPTHALIGPSTSAVVSPAAIEITWSNQNLACVFNCIHALDPASLVVKLDAASANTDVSRQFAVDPTGSRATATLALAPGDHTLDASGMLLPTPGVFGAPGLPGHPTSGHTAFTVVQQPLSFQPSTLRLNVGQAAPVTITAGQTPTGPVNVWLIPDLASANVVRLGSQPANSLDTITIQPPSTSAIETITGNQPGATTIAASAAGQATGLMSVTVLPLPKPGSLNPAHGVVGAVIRIIGANFDPTQVVAIDGTQAAANFVNQGEIDFAIPQISASVHSVSVQGQGNLTLTVDPGALTASPSPLVLTIGQPAQLTMSLPAAAPQGGVSLSLAASPSNLAQVGAFPPVAPNGAATSAAITGLALGSGALQVSGVGYAQLTVPLTVAPPPPALTGLSPSHGVVGGDIQLSGANFDPSQAITIDGSPVTSRFVSPGELHFNIPQIRTGSHAVAVDGSNALPLTVDTGTLAASPAQIRVAVGQTSPLTVTLPVPAPPGGVTLSVSASPANLVQIGALPPVGQNNTSTAVSITGRANGSGSLQITGTGFATLALPFIVAIAPSIVVRTSNIDVQAFDFTNAASPVVVSQQSASAGGGGGNNAADIASDGVGHVFRTSTNDIQVYSITPAGILSSPSQPISASPSNTGVALAAVGPSGARGPLIVRSFEQGVDVFELIANVLVLQATCRSGSAACPNIATVNVGTAIDLSGSLAVRSKDVGIEVIDVSTPTAPVVQGHYDTGEAALTGSAIKIFAGGASAVRGTPSGIEVYDISNPATPQLRGAAHGFPGSNGAAVAVDSTGAHAVRVHGQGIEVYDITNAASPMLISGTGGTPGMQLAMALIGATAFRGTELQIEAYDVSNPGNIQRLGFTPSSGPNSTTASLNAVGLAPP